MARSAACGVAAALLACAAAAAAPAPARADAQADYASLFGADEKKVLSTPTTKDDAAFAATLLGKAADLKDAPDLRRLVLARAVELGQKDADGLETAVEAAKLFIADSKGVEKLSWQSKLVDLYAAQYRRATGPKRNEAGAFLLNVLKDEAESLAAQGKYAEAAKRLKDGQSIASAIQSHRFDEFADRWKEMQAKQAAAERLDKLKQRYDTQGGDVGILEQVIFGYLLELGNTTRAAELAGRHPDKSWERGVKLASTPNGELAEDDFLELAGWLRRSAEKLPPANRAAVLERACRALRAFLVAHKRQDAASLKASTELAETWRASLQSAAPDRLLVWNAHNAQFADRGSLVLNVKLLEAGKVVWGRDAVRIDWFPTREGVAQLPLPRVTFDAVRVEVAQWKGFGPALAEVQVMRGDANLAAGIEVASGGEYVGPTGVRFPAAAVVDGITASAEVGKGYWLGLDNRPGWVELNFVPRVKAN